MLTEGWGMKVRLEYQTSEELNSKSFTARGSASPILSHPPKKPTNPIPLSRSFKVPCLSLLTSGSGDRHVISTCSLSASFCPIPPQTPSGSPSHCGASQAFESGHSWHHDLDCSSTLELHCTVATRPCRASVDD